MLMLVVEIFVHSVNLCFKDFIVQHQNLNYANNKPKVIKYFVNLKNSFLLICQHYLDFGQRFSLCLRHHEQNIENSQKTETGVDPEGLPDANSARKHRESAGDEEGQAWDDEAGGRTGDRIDVLRVKLAHHQPWNRTKTDCMRYDENTERCQRQPSECVCNIRLGILKKEKSSQSTQSHSHDGS